VAGERALLAGRNYMTAVADSIGEGLFTLDTEGRLIYLNRAGEQLLGWSLETLAGRVLHDVTHTRRLDGTPLPIDDCPILAARREGRTVRVEEDVFTRRDGSDLPVAYTASPFETADGVEGCVVVFEDISERKAREEVLLLQAGKFAWIGRIQDALTTDRLVLYSQPIVDLTSGAIVQRELLLRMREPDGGLVGPGEFLEVAEHYGLIGEIDRWVIERGVDIAARSGSGVELNLSARSIGDPAMLEHIERCIGRAGADPELIVIEITETAILEDAEAARAFAARLREIGCKLALDDFGTGYGGFTYLKQLPVDYLKIDIEFVRDLATNPGSRHVVEAVVALAHGFELKTVAEGVEDAETLELLHSLGVDFAQGYHIARPAPLDLLTGDR
jgi:PAS domain S-box-containing protein